MYNADLRHCSKLQNVMMYPVQLADVFNDTFRPLIESAINVSTELDEIVAGQAVKGYVAACRTWRAGSSVTKLSKGM